FQLSKSEDFIETFWACAFAGIVPAPITLPKVLSSDDVESKMVNKKWERLGEVNLIVRNGISENYIAMGEKLGINKKYIINLKELRNNEESNENYPVKPEDPAIIFFTSGSTGMPKGVIQTNEAVIKRQLGVTQLFNSKKDVSLNWMPLEHAGGILMSHLRGVMLGDVQVQVETQYILED